jgi:hypothetical protein
MATTFNSTIATSPNFSQEDRLLMIDGELSSGLLALSFRDDPTCGIYRSGANAWHFVNDNVAVLSLTGYDATNTAPIQFSTTGTMIGTASTELIGFYGVDPPVAQQAYINTTPMEGDFDEVYGTAQAKIIAMRTVLQSVASALANLGLMASE